MIKNKTKTRNITKQKSKVKIKKYIFRKFLS